MNGQTSRRGGVPALALALAALAALAAATVALSWPATQTAVRTPGPALDASALRTGLAGPAWERGLAEVAACGPRAVGQPGLERAAELVAAACREAGGEVVELPVEGPQVATLESRLAPADGATVADLAVHPLPPNLLQPVVSPAGGLRRRLVLVDQAFEDAGLGGDGALALVDAAAPAAGFGLSWSRYAELGFSGLVVTHRDGLPALDWNGAVAAGTGSAPVDFPRVVATPAALGLAGREVVLTVRSAWQRARHRAIVARFGPRQANAEAVAVSVAYDQVGAVAGVVPGPVQDLPLAAALAMVRALGPQRERMGRDLLLVATAGGDEGLSWLLSAAGAQQGGEAGRAWWRERAATAQAELDQFAALAAAAQAPGFLADAGATQAAWRGLPAAARTRLAEVERVVVNERVAELQEEALHRRLALLRAGPEPGALPDPGLLDAYVAARRRADAVSALASWPAAQIAARSATLAREHDLGGRLARCLGELLDERRTQVAQAGQALRIGELFARYRVVVAVEPRPVPGGGTEEVALTRGHGTMPMASGQAVHELCQRLDAGGAGLLPLGGSRYSAAVNGGLAGAPLHATRWSLMGYPAAALVHTGRSGAWRSLTAPVPAGSTTAGCQGLLRMSGELVAALASGRGEIPLPQRAEVRPWGGTVFASGVGAGLVPNQPLAGALVLDQELDGLAQRRPPGYRASQAMLADRLGRYGVPPGPFEVASLAWDGKPYEPQCAAFGGDGRVAWVKDCGARAQSLYRSLTFGWNPPRTINLVAFRAEPAVVLDRVDPRLLRPWAEVRAVTRDGLAAPASLAVWEGRGGLGATYLPPDRFVYFRLVEGSPDNPLVRTPRSVLLGEAPAAGRGRLAPGQPGGLGYLPADRPWIAEPARIGAASLLRLDAPRLALQERQGLGRAELAETASAAALALARAGDTALPMRARQQAARIAAAHAQKNHQDLEESIRQAVANIVWYLCLLVPFALFLEKLAVGSADVRRQLGWSAGIFLAAFLLLALLHPAFPLLASPAMILLGFVILLIALAMAAVFLGRFQENLRHLQARRGQVEGARVDLMGVTATAFLLGLNGLSRRKVRTGLTCATLVLITFALICFAGVQRRGGVSATAIGPAPYQGLLATDAVAGYLSAEEAAALRARYSPAHRVVTRGYLVGREDDRSKERFNPQVDLALPGEMRRAARCQSLLQWDHAEPLAGRLRLLAGRPWAQAAGLAPAGSLPLLVPGEVAAALGIAPAAVDAGAVPATLCGRPAAVVGIFDAASLGAVRDLDGRSPLPFDLEATVKPQRNKEWRLVAGPDDPLIAPERLVIAPGGALGVQIPNAEERLASCAVVLDGLPYREAATLLAEHQRLGGRPLAYGLDGTAFIGRPAPAGGFGGVDLLIPLAIAALTVLNTMRGSVYERRDEIAVFNAVGIAPRFIAAMFFAEALVYAVVGAVAGFLLSLLLGRGLALLGWDLGLELDVASLAPVWASLALAAAVFLSTWFPARQAAEIAAPSDGSGWKVPEPEGDRLAIELPFAFDRRDRVAVLAFFARFFRDHGEGGAGPFQAGEPALAAERAAGGAVPRLACRIWLKPFDLGVAQDLEIALLPDPHGGEGESLAHLTLVRRTGTREAWLRLNAPFLAVLRRHFLYWRAVDAPLRAELFDEACAALRAARTGSEDPAHG